MSSVPAPKARSRNMATRPSDGRFLSFNTRPEIIMKIINNKRNVSKVLLELTKKNVEALRKNPSPFILDYPIFHLPESILLLWIQQSYDGANQIFEIRCLLQ